MLRLAVLYDKLPPKRGQVYEYWRGSTDVEPNGKRGEVFREAMRLFELGRVLLYQVKCDEGYSYRCVVT